MNKVSNFKIKKLKWDSDFFGYKIGKVIINKEKELEELQKFIKNSEFDMVQVFSKFPFQHHAKPIDTKLTFKKRISNDRINNYNIKSYKGEVNEYLISLSQQAGLKSRYNLDNKLNYKFEKMYETWINKSLSRKLADEVYVHEKQKKIIGMITVFQKGDNAEIGLVAVSKNSRGSGLGTTLLESVERWGYNRNLKFVEVSTQKENTGACKFYKKNGFLISNETFIYHIWNK